MPSRGGKGSSTISKQALTSSSSLGPNGTTGESNFTVHPFRKTCNECGKDYESPATYHVHHPCFEKSSYYLKSFLMETESASISGDFYQCKFCSKTFQELSVLQQHIRYEVPDEEKIYECLVCHHRFVCRRDVIRHVGSHLKEKNFPCRFPDCERRYADRFNLQRHMEREHGGRPVYNCCLCGLECTSEFKLKKHRDKAHPHLPLEDLYKNSPYVCQHPGCGKIFTQKQQVKRHYESTHLSRGGSKGGKSRVPSSPGSFIPHLNYSNLLYSNGTFNVSGATEFVTVEVTPGNIVHYPQTSTSAPAAFPQHVPTHMTSAANRAHVAIPQIHNHNHNQSQQQQPNLSTEERCLTSEESIRGLLNCHHCKNLFLNLIRSHKSHS